MKEIEKPRNQERIDAYGLPTPFSLKGKFKYGEISPLFAPTKRQGKISFFAFAASVLNKSDPFAIENIGSQIGSVTASNDQIRLVEAPFLGCGDGGLMPSIAVQALASGFLSTSHPDAVLQLCSDNALSVEIAKNALDSFFEARRLGSKSFPLAALSGVARKFDYDVALSFAGAQRPFMASMSSLLKAEGVRVFYDNDEEAHLWGKNLYDYLYQVYSANSRYCVILVSHEYSIREWTNHERQAAQERAFREKDQEYILPVNFDDTQLKSMPRTIGYLRASLGVERISQLLLQKLRST